MGALLFYLIFSGAINAHPKQRVKSPDHSRTFGMNIHDGNITSATTGAAGSIGVSSYSPL